MRFVIITSAAKGQPALYWQPALLCILPLLAVPSVPSPIAGNRHYSTSTIAANRHYSTSNIAANRYHSTGTVAAISTIAETGTIAANLHCSAYCHYWLSPSVPSPTPGNRHYSASTIEAPLAYSLRTLRRVSPSSSQTPNGRGASRSPQNPPRFRL